MIKKTWTLHKICYSSVKRLTSRLHELVHSLILIKRKYRDKMIVYGVNNAFIDDIAR